MKKELKKVNKNTENAVLYFSGENQSETPQGTWYGWELTCIVGCKNGGM